MLGAVADSTLVVTAATFWVELEVDVGVVLLADTDDVAVVAVSVVVEPEAECSPDVLPVLPAGAALVEEAFEAAVDLLADGSLVGVVEVLPVVGVLADAVAVLLVVVVPVELLRVVTVVLAPPEAVTMPATGSAVDVDFADDVSDDALPAVEVVVPILGR